MEDSEAPDSEVDSSEHLVPNPASIHLGQWPGSNHTYNSGNCNEAEPNPRKRKLDEDSNEDVISVKSETVHSVASVDLDMKQTYGLKHEFLKSLGIHPPIDKWVSVSNFRCDKSELKEVLELAGQVVVCSVITIRNRYAKVMYSHPLEAVQAVSMLHGQMFYGLKLQVLMIPSLENLLVLPKGLAKIGPGLGTGGLPLRDVVQHFKKYLKRKNTLVDKRLFCSADEIKDVLLVDNDENDTNQSNEFIPGERWINPFKLVPVEEIPDGNDAVSFNDSESDSKKAKRDDDNSDQESDNENEKQNNAPDRGFRSNTSPETNPIPTLNSNQALRRNVSPANVPRAQSHPHTGQGSLHSPPVNIYGMSSQQVRFLPTARPIGPFVPPVRPMGHPSNTNMCPPSRPLGPPINNMGMPVRPALGPPNSRPQNRFPGPITGPTGPPAAITTVRAPAAHMRPPIVPLNIGPFPYVSPRPFQGGSPSAQHPMMMSQVRPPGEVAIKFNNLPPSTTFSLLCDKVSQCGQLVSLQLTTPGCAIAIFKTKEQADRCYQLLNRAFIDGCQICVSYV